MDERQHYFVPDGNNDFVPKEPLVMQEPESLGGKIRRQVKFMWNLIDPRWGRATVYVSRHTGEVTKVIPHPSK